MESTARMISSKKLNRMARKWQKLTIMRKRTSLPGKSTPKVIAGDVDESPIAEKGHFVVYTTDQTRHVVPLSYLSNSIFVELLKLSEEEFGLSSHDPIKLPCDSALFEYIVFIVQQGLDKHLLKSLLSSIFPSPHSLRASFHQGRTGQLSLVCGY